MQKYIDAIKKYSAENYRQMLREPDGVLAHPFIVPGSASYNNCLWDWDSWLTDVAVRQIMADNDDYDEKFIESEKGCVINFLEHMDADGKMPICITPENETNFSHGGNFSKPCLIQHAAFIVRENGGDADWLMPHVADMKRFLDCYRNLCFHSATGLYFWLNDAAIGVDNDPCTFYRPNKSSASIYLNCLMYKELTALVYICGILGEDAAKYDEYAENVKNAINTHLWDERDGFYYSADLNLLPVDPNAQLHKGAPRNWDCLIQRIDVWSGVMALWAGIASPEQAERTARHITNPDTFWAPYGIRTLAKTEKMYQILKTGNPSCWLGPIWGISNWMCFKGLADYGLNDAAKEIAEKSIKLFGEDVITNGEFHEYYHPDTGEGVINPGFQNWNLLAANMIAWLEGRPTVEEF